MKQLIYGGILMVTGMLGVIVSLMLLIIFSFMGASIPFLIFFALAILFAIMVFLGYYEHVRPAMKDGSPEEKE